MQKQYAAFKVGPDPALKAIAAWTAFNSLLVLRYQTGARVSVWPKVRTVLMPYCAITEAESNQLTPLVIAAVRDTCILKRLGNRK